MENLTKGAYILAEYNFFIRFIFCFVICVVILFLTYSSFRYHFIQPLRIIICILISVSVFIFLLFFQIPMPVNKAVLTLSLVYDPLSIRSMWNTPYLMDCIYEKLPDNEAIIIWELYTKQEPLTEQESKSKKAFDVYYRRVIGANNKKEVFAKKLDGISGDVECSKEFANRCNELKWSEQIGDEIFNDWKVNLEIVGEGKIYLLLEEIGKSGISKYYFNEIFGSLNRLQVIYIIPIDDKRKWKDLLDMNGKLIHFRVRTNKNLNLYLASARLDFGEKHKYEDMEKWDEKLTTKSIFFAYDYDSEDWRMSSEWKRKQGVITKKDDGIRSIWSGEYTVPSNYFKK